jgi:hypothetical protein
MPIQHNRMVNGRAFRGPCRRGYQARVDEGSGGDDWVQIGTPAVGAEPSLDRSWGKLLGCTRCVAEAPSSCDRHATFGSRFLPPSLRGQSARTGRPIAFRLNTRPSPSGSLNSHRQALLSVRLYLRCPMRQPRQAYRVLGALCPRYLQPVRHVLSDFASYAETGVAPVFGAVDTRHKQHTLFRAFFENPGHGISGLVN